MSLQFQDLNELTEALKCGNWKASVGICESHPSLVNTIDSHNWTPLFHLMNSINPPEDVVTVLVKHASKKCIGHISDYYGLTCTFVHYLAKSPYTEALEHALEKTGADCVNMPSSDGNTPLHHCFSNQFSSMRKKKSNAVNLVSYGASCFAENKMHLTPLEMIGNHSQRNELKEILRVLTVPAEILARGQDAVKAYTSDMENGHARVNGRCLILGDEGAGKKCCLKSLLGNEFDEAESSVFETMGNYGKNWEEKKEESKHTKHASITSVPEKSSSPPNLFANQPQDEQDLRQVFNTLPKKSRSIKNKKRKQERECPQYVDIASELEKSSSSPNSSANQPQVEQDPATSVMKFDAFPKKKFSLRKNKRSQEFEPTKRVTNTLNPKKTPSSSNQPQVEADQVTLASNQPQSRLQHLNLKNWFKSIRNKSSKESYVTNKQTWNKQTGDPSKKVDERSNESSPRASITHVFVHSEEPPYYLLHRVFLNFYTHYIIAFSLRNLLDKLANPGLLEKEPFESLTSWIRSVYEYVILNRKEDAEEQGLINGKIAPPPITLVATHKDQLKGTEKEKQKQIDEIQTKILDKMKYMPYEKHVDRVIHVVDNTNPRDEGIHKLKKTIDQYTKEMARTIPMSYVNLQSKLQEIGQTKLRMSLDEIIEIAVECGISEENAMHVVNYFSDIRVVLYLPINNKLKKTVILNVDMLVKMFLKVITDVDHHNPDKEGFSAAITDWHNLVEKGELHKELLLFLWKNELKIYGEKKHIVLDECIELMKTFGLIFEMEHEGDCVCIVPSRIRRTTSDHLQAVMDDEQTVSIYVTPKYFLPNDLYNVMIIKLLYLSEDQSFRNTKKLFQNQAVIKLDQINYVKLGTVQIDNKKSLKIEIKRVDKVDENGNAQPPEKPKPKICMKVLNLLRCTLDNLIPSKLCGYTLGILCHICGQQHLQNLLVCLKTQEVSCGKVSVSKPTDTIRALFKEESPFLSRNGKQPIIGRTKVPSEREKKKRFQDFFLEFIVNYHGEHFLWLRCLLYDHLTISEMESQFKEMHFFNILCRERVISFTDVEICSEIAEETEIQSAIECVSDYKARAQCYYSGGDKKLTNYRRQLFRALREVSKADFIKVICYYNLEDLGLKNIWDVVFHLEMKKLLSNNEEDKTNFANLLNPTAKDILLDIVSPSTKRRQGNFYWLDQVAV